MSNQWFFSVFLVFWTHYKGLSLNGRRFICVRKLVFFLAYFQFSYFETFWNFEHFGFVDVFEFGENDFDLHFRPSKYGDHVFYNVHT